MTGRRPRRPLPFTARFALILGLLGVLIVAASAVIPLAQTVTERRQQALDRAAVTADLAASLSLAQQQALQSFAQAGAEQLRQPGDQPPDLPAAAQRLSAAEGQNDLVAVVADGAAVAQGGRLLSPGSARLAWLSQVTSAQGPLQQSQDGAQWMVGTFQVPGPVRVTVARAVDTPFLAALAADVGLSGDESLALVRGGRYAAGRGPAGAVGSGQPVEGSLGAVTATPGAAGTADVSGERAVATRALGAGHLLVTIPVPGVLGAVGGVAGPLGVAGGALILLALMIVFIVVERDLYRPLRRLDRAVTALGREEFDAPLPSGGDETVGRVAASFDAMRRRLRAVLAGAETRAAMAADLSGAQPADHALATVAHRLCAGTGARCAVVAVGGHDVDEPTLVAHACTIPADATSLLRGDGPLAVAARGEGPIVVCGLPGTAEWAAGLREICAAPLRIGQRTLGAVCIADAPEGFEATEADLVAAAAEQISLALERERVLALVRRQASTDGLTGLRNYRFLVEHLDQQVALAERSGAPLAVLMLDLDHFKALNDEHGHAAGDEALRRVAHCLEATVRRSDLAARYGGEEFVIVMADTGRDEARLVADKLRTAVADLQLPIAGSVRRLTVSIGGAVLPDDARETSPLLAMADAALYRAKHAGRDAVRFANE